MPGSNVIDVGMCENIFEGYQAKDPSRNDWGLYQVAGAGFEPATSGL